MDTPIYSSQIIVGGPNQQTQFFAMPPQIITRQSGQLNLQTVFQANDETIQSFDISGVTNSDAYFVPYNSSELRVTAGTGVVSYTGEQFTITANADSTPTAGTWTITVNGETTAGIAFDADETDVLSALEALPSRSPGDFEIRLINGSNISDTGATMTIELSGGFDLDARSSADFSGLTGGTTPTFTTDIDQSTIQDFYSVTWVKDTIPAGWSTFDPDDREGSIAIYFEFEDANDFYQAYNRFNVTDGNLAGNQQATPQTNAIQYYNPTYEYDNTSTADANPGTGKYAMNSTLLASVTEIYINDFTLTNVDYQVQWQNLGPGSTVYFSNPNVVLEAAYFTVSGAPTNNTDYTTVPVTFQSTGTTSFTSGSLFSFTIDQASSSASFGITYDFDTATSDADPGAGKFRLNNSDPTLATFAYIADDDNGGVNESAYLQSLGSGDYLRFSVIANMTAAARYTVSGTPTNATGYTKVPLTYVDSGAGSFNADDECTFTIDKAGAFSLVDDTSPQLGGTLDANSNQIREAKGADVASAAALTLGTDGNFFDITGTTTITSINTLAVGTKVTLQFDGILTLTHNATDLILPTAANITTAAGDTAQFIEYASGDWICTNYQRADGTPLAGAGGASGILPTSESSKTADYTILAGDIGTRIELGSATAADRKFTLDVSLFTDSTEQISFINKSTYRLQIEVSNTGTMTFNDTSTDLFLWKGDGILTVNGDTSTNANVVARG